jgi:hypothetical protein
VAGANPEPQIYGSEDLKGWNPQWGVLAGSDVASEGVDLSICKLAMGSYGTFGRMNDLLVAPEYLRG